MSVHLYDSLSRKQKPLSQPKDRPFYFYCCGPTVYGPAHIGNFRTFLIQDVLRRVLEVDGIQVEHVRNITDVDDKTIRQSQLNGQSLKAFTQKWVDKFHEDCASLNLLPPNSEPRAVDHIGEQIALIEQLMEKKHAYLGRDGSVYFSVQSYPEYGCLNRIDQSELQTQSSNSAGHANLADEYERECISDFALWKARKEEDGDNFWPSPWGDGRPGWHLECSAMVHSSFQGATIDLHGGGIDLCFPHHENEIAQSQAAYDKPFCRHWFHSAHLKVEGEKMSKSLGNLYTLDDLIAKNYHPMTLRYTLIASSYRQPLNFTFASLHASESALMKIDRFAESLIEKLGLKQAQFNSEFIQPHRLKDFGLLQNAWDSLCHNLNTSACLGALFGLIGSNPSKELSPEACRQTAKALGALLYALGLKLFQKPITQSNDREVPASILELAEKRWTAKQNKDYAQADSLRKALLEQGWEVKDAVDHFELKPNPRQT
ncbi:MAG: cysteine--tRNA ligase [Puniceicoccaceae bacterium]|nr:cysteine--tRNA ligase [Puniceicoccaceae bacterium]